MKQFSLILALVGMFTMINTQAQEVANNKTEETNCCGNNSRIGGVVSPSILNTGNNNDFTSQSISVGVAYDYFLIGKGLTFSTGLQFTTVKAEEQRAVENLTNNKSTGLFYSVTQEAQYITIPLTFKLRSKEIKEHYKAYGQAGINNNLKISGETNEVNPTTQVLKEMEDDVSQFNIAGTIGGGIERKIQGCRAVSAGISYNLGLTDFNSSTNSRSNNIALNFGFFF